jgi:hypothetical protein
MDTLARIFHELLSRDHEDGRACPPCEQGEACEPPGNRRVLVSVPERYVAGADTRGRQEG